MKTEINLSVIIITYNEENNIQECLESVNWCSEIIIIDSNSTDKTCEIASKFTNNIYKTENLSYGEKRNIGIEKASNDWILWLDADERIPRNLADEIIKVIHSDNLKHFVYLINRKSYFINKFIRYCSWYPDYTIRLFKKNTGLRFNTSFVHEKIEYKGNPGKLKNEILHYTDRDFEHYINKLNIYTSLSSEELYRKGKKSRIIDIIFRPVFTFIKMYFLRLGILDGYTGLILCYLSSIHVFVKYSKLYYLIKNK